MYIKLSELTWHRVSAMEALAPKLLLYTFIDHKFQLCHGLTLARIGNLLF